MPEWNQIKRPFREALINGFNQNSLDVVLRYHCDQRLDLITPKSEPFDKNVDDVIDEAVRKGWLEKLAEGALEENKSHGGLQAIVPHILEGFEAEGRAYYQGAVFKDSQSDPEGREGAACKAEEDSNHISDFGDLVFGSEKEWDDISVGPITDNEGKTISRSVNPFTYGDPISDPDRFFGRQREVEQVFSRLLNPEAESSSLVGSRRIGKTSLLKYMADPNVRQKHGLDLDRFNFVYIDLHMLDSSTTPSKLWAYLFDQMARQCKDSDVKDRLNELRSSVIIDNFVIVGLFELIDERDRHIVLLLDEFEHVTENVNFGADFFYGLRSLAIQHNLSLITSSHKKLISLTHSETISSSPFFNIFANINLSFFRQEEARELITSSLTGTNIDFSDSEVEALLRIAGPYPHFLQAACYFMFQTYRESADSAERLKYVEEKFAEEADPHFEYFWTNSDKDEQIVLLILALSAQLSLSGNQSYNKDDLEALYSRSGQTLIRLVKRALVTEDLSGYSLFSSAFGGWIVNSLADSRGDEFGYKNWFNFVRQFLIRLRMRNRWAILLNLPVVGEKYRGLIYGWINNTSYPENAVDLLKNALY